MALQHMGKRVVLILAAVGLGLPLMMGPGCPRTVEPLAVDAGADLTTTVGSPVQLQASVEGGTLPYTVSWQPTAGLNNPSSLQPTFTPSAAGQFSFTITVNDGGGEVAGDTVVVTVNSNGSDNGHSIGGGEDDGDTGGTGEANEPDPLVVDAGPDRAATVGASITLQGSYSGGTAPVTIAWSPASSLVGSGTLTPTFTPPAVGSFTFTLTVTDALGVVEEDSMVVSVSQMATLSKLTWGANFGGDSYELLAEFSRSVDETSAERVTNYRVTGTETNPSSAVLSSDTRTVILVFSGVKLTTKSEFDISVETGVLDTNGARIPAVNGLVPLLNTEDTTAPTISAVRWAVNYNGSYGVELRFSEAMDQTSVENARAYEIEDGGVTSLAFDAVLATDGKTVGLVFQGLPLSQAAKLNVDLLTIRDINGQKLTAVSGKSISANALDLDMPLIVKDSIRFVNDYYSGGYQVVLEFNEAMDRVSAEDATAHKVDGLAASTAQLGNDGRRVTLTYLNDTYSADSKLSILGNKVRDINGRYLAAQTNLAILPASGTSASPNVPTLTWLKGDESTGYQFLARFNESMDKETVEDVENWRIAETPIHPTSVVLSMQTVGDEIAGRTAKVTFGDFGAGDTRMTRTTKVDVSVGGSIVDVNGQTLAQMTCVIVAHPADVTAPIVTNPRSGLIARPVWGDIMAAGSYSGENYIASVVFSETMDAASAVDPTNYYLAGNHPTSVSLDTSGRKVVLTFATTLSGVGSSDKLQVLGNVRDINGRRTSSVVPLAIQALPEDVMPPGINEVFWGVNKGPYEVALTFGEVMDAGSATDLTAYSIDDTSPTSASMQSDGKTLVLVFGDAKLTVASELSILGTVTDVNGNVYDGSQGDIILPAAPEARPEDDTVPADLASAVWAVDSLDYRVMATFTEALDVQTAENPLFYAALLYGFFPVTPTAATLQPGGTNVELVFPSPLEKAAVLEVTSNTPPPPDPPEGVSDMHGWLSDTDTVVGANPLDTAAVELGFFDLRAMWVSDYAMGGYQLTVTFAAEVLDLTTAETVNNYRITDTFVSPYFATLAVVDDLPNGTYAGRTITLAFDTKALSVSSELDASVGGSITDLSGNSMPQISELSISSNPADTTEPVALMAITGPPLLLGQVAVRFSEAMDETSVETVDNYTLVDPTDPLAVPAPPYAVSLDTNGMVAYLQFDFVPQSGMTLHITAVTDINSQTIVDQDLDLP